MKEVLQEATQQMRICLESYLIEIFEGVKHHHPDHSDNKIWNALEEVKKAVSGSIELLEATPSDSKIGVDGYLYLRAIRAEDKLGGLEGRLKAAQSEIKDLRDALKQIAAYPKTRSEELGYEGCRGIARKAISSKTQNSKDLTWGYRRYE